MSSSNLNCDGKCYTDTNICPCVDVCPKTRYEEFVATIAAATTVMLAPAAICGALIFVLVKYFLMAV